MDNSPPQTNLPNNNSLIQNQSIWISNPHLKMLLLVLIFVFLGCGIGLAVFSQWNSQYRQQIYEDTQAGLPVHVDKPLATSTTISGLVGKSEAPTTTPSDITSWKTYKNTQYGFEFEYPGYWVIYENKLEGDNSIEAYDKQYAERNRLEWPRLIFEIKYPQNGKYQIRSEYGNPSESKVFNKSNDSYGYNVIYLTADFGRVYANCYLADTQMILTCNQILSTFKFTK